MPKIQLSAVFSLVIILAAWSTETRAGSQQEAGPDLFNDNAVMLAQADSKAEKEDKEKPRTGTLVLPADYEKTSEKKEKKCMTVCSRWGETCVFDVNRGRKCRRTCKEFAEECF